MIQIINQLSLDKNGIYKSSKSFQEKIDYYRLKVLR